MNLIEVKMEYTIANPGPSPHGSFRNSDGRGPEGGAVGAPGFEYQVQIGATEVTKETSDKGECHLSRTLNINKTHVHV